jgi:hypothetical protein
MNVASTIRAVRLVARADSRIDSPGLVKTLFATLGTSRHFAALYYHSAHGAGSEIGGAKTIFLNRRMPRQREDSRLAVAIETRALHIT